MDADVRARPAPHERARAFADSERALERARARLAAVDREVQLLSARLTEIELGLDAARAEPGDEAQAGDSSG